MAELLQHLLTVSQVRSHELGSIHLDLLLDFSGGQARLEVDRGKIQLTLRLTKGPRQPDYRKQTGHEVKLHPLEQE